LKILSVRGVEKEPSVKKCLSKINIIALTSDIVAAREKLVGNTTK